MRADLFVSVKVLLSQPVSSRRGQVVGAGPDRPVFGSGDACAVVGDRGDGEDQNREDQKAVTGRFFPRLRRAAKSTQIAVMKHIRILGPGCPNCRRLAAAVDEVAGELGLDYEIEKVTDITRIIELGVLSPPGLVVDEELKVSGRMPSRDEVRDLLRGKETEGEPR